MNPLAIQLTLHGAIVLLFGMLSGIPQGVAIASKQSEDFVRAWRVAHSGLTAGGTTMIAVSAVLSHLNLESIAASVLVCAFVISGYGFSLSLPYAAWVGHRGISPGGSAKNQFVYVGNMIGAIGSLIGGLMLIWGCLRTL